jgi:RNA polymerase subunit RPABC4/transcription elongation factor Spt4
MAENRCVVCGEIIPEGRQVCPTCEVMSNKEIEELATEIYTLFRSHPMSKAMARHLYDKGWRKQKEGEWIKDEESKFEHRYHCSVCNFYLIGEPTKYCEDCGAKMKGGAE